MRTTQTWRHTPFASSRRLASTLTLIAFLLTGCESGLTGATDDLAPTDPATTPVQSISTTTDITVDAGETFTVDVAALLGVSPVGLTILLEPIQSGVTVDGSTISGQVADASTLSVSVAVAGQPEANRRRFFVFVTANRRAPNLPSTPFTYADAALPIPAHYTDPGVPGSVARADNTPPDNPVTDAGATLGRVLFYDVRLSANDRTSCASCHRQADGFSDRARQSRGFQGGLTARHSMSLANARYYQSGRLFWDERAETLEDQVLMPIQDGTEMGMSLDVLERKLAAVPFYAELFQSAFGTPEVTSERISLALSQFVRSLVSYRSRFDEALSSGDPATVLTAEELRGMELFGAGPRTAGVSLGCDRCHGATAQIADRARNNGLDANTKDDQGAGDGRFKVPSLRNVAVTGPYMHDGRFRTLNDVIDFYERRVQDHPELDPILRDQNGQPRRLRISREDRAALIAFLETLTDREMLTDVKFSDPFRA